MKRKKKYKHCRGRNRHHLRPRARHGSNGISNMLLIDIERHEYFHRIFGLKSLDEVIELLIRVKRAKEAQGKVDYVATKTTLAYARGVQTHVGDNQQCDFTPVKFGRKPKPADRHSRFANELAEG